MVSTLAGQGTRRGVGVRMDIILLQMGRISILDFGDWKHNIKIGRFQHKQQEPLQWQWSKWITIEDKGFVHLRALGGHER
jgi:hypothetical protein